MNTSKQNPASEAPKCATITLLDGRELPVILRPEQPAEVRPDDLALDITGQYLSIGNKRHKKSRRSNKKISIEEAKERYYRQLFIENVHLFLDESDKILSDGRLFFAPVHVPNHLAYTGTSGFQNPTIGVYLQWWLHAPEASFDENENPIWFISGSPLSGAHACSAVNKNCECVKAQLKGDFLNVWRSFKEINQELTEAKQRCEAYTFEEALIQLRGQEYAGYMEKVLHKFLQE